LVAKDWAVVDAFCATAMQLPVKLHVEIRETLVSKLEPVLKVRVSENAGRSTIMASGRLHLRCRWLINK